MSDPTTSEQPRPEILAILAELFRFELNLPQNPPRVFIYNQPWKIPPIKGLFVEVALLSPMPYAGSLSYDGSGDGLNEVRTINSRDIYTVDLFSVDESARRNCFRAISALNSTRAQQLCEQYSFKFGTLPTAFQDISEIEATRRLNRYQATFTVLSAETFIQPVDYYNNFKGSPVLTIQP